MSEKRTGVRNACLLLCFDLGNPAGERRCSGGHTVFFFSIREYISSKYPEVPLEAQKSGADQIDSALSRQDDTRGTFMRLFF